MRYAQPQHVGHDLLGERQIEAALFSATNRQQASMDFQKKMRQPLERRAPAEVDDVLGIDCRLMRGKPAQGQAELRLLVAKLHVSVEWTDVVGEIADRNDRID